MEGRISEKEIFEPEKKEERVDGRRTWWGWHDIWRIVCCSL